MVLAEVLAAFGLGGVAADVIELALTGAAFAFLYDTVTSAIKGRGK